MSTTVLENFVPANHESTTDPESRLYRKSSTVPALPSYLGHVLTGNRHGLVVNGGQHLGRNGRARRSCKDAGRRRGPGKRETVGADKAYDTKGFVKARRQINVTPHGAQNINRNGGSAIDGRATGTRAARSANARRSASSSVSAGANSPELCTGTASAAMR